VWKNFLANLKGSPLLMTATAVLLAFVVIGVAAPVLAPRDPAFQDLRQILMPPSADFWFGSDEYGRDLTSRLIFGARNSLIVGISVVLLSGIIGSVFGILAGYFGGWVDTVIMRLADVMMAFPYLVLALGLIAVLGAGLTGTIIALTIAFAPIYVRIVRSRVIVVRNEAYIDASVLIGLTPAQISFRHILPNVTGAVVVQGALTFAFAVLSEASLSFVGLGVPPPASSFGNIIASGRDYIVDAPWITTSSGMAIVIIVLSLLILADGLRNAVDPYHQNQ
jgi:peptide/nickel transport system permease protein